MLFKRYALFDEAFSCACDVHLKFFLRVVTFGKGQQAPPNDTQRIAAEDNDAVEGERGEDLVERFHVHSVTSDNTVAAGHVYKYVL